MTYSIAILTHSPLRQIIEPVLKTQASEMGMSISIVAIDAVYEEGARIIESMEDRIDLIICGRIHENILRNKAITTPIFTLYPRDNDLINSIMQATKYDNEINIISPVRTSNKNLVFVEPLFQKLGIKVKEITYQDQVEINPILEELIAQGRKVVIGGTLVCDMVRKYEDKIHSIYYFTKEAIAEEVKYALYLLQKKDNFLGGQYLATLVNQIPFGVILCYSNGKIKLLNSIAENIISCSTEYAQCKDIANVIPDFDFNDLADCSGKIVNLRGKNYYVSAENADFDSLINIIFLKPAKSNLPKENTIHVSQAGATFDKIVGVSKSIKNTVALAKQYAVTDETILITGETGSGKDIFAQSIHNYSLRKNGPFWAINCAALPENLLESELFGYEEGAFTGAKKGGKLGFFELANHGTLFLDEIGELSLNVQVKLLRALEHRQILRLGGKHLIPVDVRIICATNRDLYEAIRQKNFREDLFYRINVLQLQIPPLRERRDDIVELIKYFYNQIEPNNKNIQQDTDLLIDILEKYQWPGNVRELENIIRKFLVMKKIFNTKAELKASLSNLIYKPKTNNIIISEPKKNKEVTLEMIKKAIIQNNGNKSKAAKELGISRVTLWRRLEELEIQSRKD